MTGLNEVSAATPGGSDAVLRCVMRRMETHDSATFALAPSDAGGFDYRPGQFVLVSPTIAGKKYQRAYSISSSPSKPDLLEITVKRVANGTVSNWLIDELNQGDSLEVSQPIGEFCLGATELSAHTILISAGSGITPTMSMARWLLDTAQTSEIHFIHCARDAQNVIFLDELEGMAARHTNFHLKLVYSRGQLPDSGRLTEARLAALLPAVKNARAFLCGQDALMTQVEAWLQAAGMSESHIRKESFTPAAPVAVDETATQYSLTVPGHDAALQIAAGQSLLDVMEGAGLPILGACRSGICGSCKCKVSNGSVVSTSKETLTEAELAQGYVLACSSTPASDLIVELG